MCFYFSIAVDLFFGLKFLDVSHIYGKRFCRLNQVSAAYQKDKTCSPQGNHKRVQWRLAIVPRKRGMQEHSRVNVVAFFVKKSRRHAGTWDSCIIRLFGMAWSCINALTWTCRGAYGVAYFAVLCWLLGAKA